MSSHLSTPIVPAFGHKSRFGLVRHGISPEAAVFWNLPPAELVEQALLRGEGKLVAGGGLATTTTPHTGRSPQDRFVVQDERSAPSIWWGPVNVPLARENYQRLRAEVAEHLSRRDLFVRDMWAGADPELRIAVRTVTPSAWHNLFAYNMLRRPRTSEADEMEPGFTILHAPDLQADPTRHGTRTGTFIVLDLDAGEVLIGGTRYAGEIKKAVFSAMNHLLPQQGVLSMHCAANVGIDGDTALFFGLSGTGKTTLSADPERRLIGDDEHGWSDRGVFNIEGGCYAKVIRLAPRGEPEIFAATRRFGTILENVRVEPDRAVDLDSDEIAENTRASYPLQFIPNFVPTGTGGHPTNIIFLTADAYGVLPPIARLTPPQAMYHFLSGYTAKVAGTERGISEPKATFSACFGAPFLPLHPSVYARLLGERIERHHVRVWLCNTGWTGGPYGTGHRIDLAYTRAMVREALTGRLDRVATEPDPVFGLSVPTAVRDVPSELLRPRETWGDPAAFDARAAELVERFRENFESFADRVSAEVRGAGPS